MRLQACRTLVLSLAWAVLALGAAALAQPIEEFGKFNHRLLEVKRGQLGQVLGVEQRTVEQLLDIDRRYQPQRQQLTQAMKNEFRQLQQLISQPAPPEQEIMAILSRMKSHRREMLDLQQRKADEEMALLTPVQQARYLMYMMNLVKEARSIRRGPGGMGPWEPAPPREIPVSRPAAPGGQ